MTNEKVPVIFLNGHSSRQGLIGVLGFPEMLDDDVAFCRFFMGLPNDNKWVARDLDFVSASNFTKEYKIVNLTGICQK